MRAAIPLILLLGFPAFDQNPAQTSPTQPASPPDSPAQTAGSEARSGLRVVVLDPGHGGADAGARGPTGVLEKDVVLSLARILRQELTQQGWLVVLTREGNENPSFDDRAALANARHAAVFLTLHVSSAGRVGTARAFYLKRAETVEKKPGTAPGALPAGLLRWEEGQMPYVEQSRRFAELLQVQFGQTFRGSAEVPLPAAVRQLRSITAPAVAVELSSVSVAESVRLEQMGPELAAAIVRALEAFRLVYEGGAG